MKSPKGVTSTGCHGNVPQWKVQPAFALDNKSFFATIVSGYQEITVGVDMITFYKSHNVYTFESSEVIKILTCLNLRHYCEPWSPC